MPRISFLPIILRETLGSRKFPREPEPDLVMEDPDQVAAYAHAGRVEGVMSASYLFHTAHCTETIFGAKKVVDLGCGPATQLCQLAQYNPDTEFIGIDLSQEMLAKAETYAKERNIGNVHFLQGDITRLNALEKQSVDAVISTMALHHLPKLGLLETCMSEIQRILRPDGAIYLTDFCRLKSLYSVLFFAYMNARHQPHLFSLDYERSLRAAFEFNEFCTLAARQLPQAGVHTTFLVPFLAIISTPKKQLPASLKNEFNTLRKTLPRRYRGDLDDMRLFFKLGGLSGDPFRT